MSPDEEESDRLYALLSAQPQERLVASVARMALSQRTPQAHCPLYFQALEAALHREPPPFATKHYAEIYRVASTDGQWMAISLMTNAEREGDGARRLWSLAACSVDSKDQQLLKRHAVDESRHALNYLMLLDLSFPTAVTPSFRSQLNALSPGYLMDQPLFAVEGSPYARTPSIDDFLQMNIAEIRTAIHHVMQRPALAAHCSPGIRARVTAIQKSLLRDELHHVAYTAVLIERIAKDANPATVSELFRSVFVIFNQITNEELGENVFDCSLACCAKRPWCRAKVTSHR